MSLHPILTAAAEGTLPPWSRAGEERLAHMRRVAGLLESWAGRRGCSDEEVVRWRAAGLLHDAVREEDPETLRGWVEAEQADLPASVMHGPAAAARLREEGVTDEGFLRAVAYHTIGHPALDSLGRALYAADFLEPGRTSREQWRAELRSRMPEETDAVVREVARARIGGLLEEFRPIPRETFRFWNVIAAEARPQG